MKNYEEMAQSVLKRRDIEIKRRRRAFLIGAPCAAAVLVGVVGIGAAVISRYRGGQLDDLIYYNYNPGAAEIGSSAENSGIAETATVDRPASSTAEIAVDFDPYEGNDIKILDIDEFNIPENVPNLDVMTFFEYSLEELSHFYSIDINRLGKLHPNWETSYGKLGLYNVELEKVPDGVILINKPYGSYIEYTRNNISYTTEGGASITVSAQNEKFEPVSKEVFTDDKPIDPSKYTSETAYDENGNPIGTMVYPIDSGDTGRVPDEGISTVNGYEALIYRSANGDFLADLDMGTRVRITAEGLSEHDFITILDEFTEKDYIDIAPDMPVETDPPVNDYTNPNAGDTKIDLLFIQSEDDVKPDSTDILDENDFTPYSLENLDSFYSLRFNRLGELYPTWKLSYDKLGVYRHETNDGMIASLELVGTLNTLNYTTESGGTVSVSAQYKEFAMPLIGDHIATFKKDINKHMYPDYDSDIHYEYDENGNVIGMSTGAYDPSAQYIEGETNPDTDDSVWSRINGYDALVVAVLDSENNVDHYTAYIDMTSYVKITAYDIDQFTFADILDNFTK